MRTHLYKTTIRPIWVEAGTQQDLRLPWLVLKEEVLLAETFALNLGTLSENIPTNIDIWKTRKAAYRFTSIDSTKEENHEEE